MENDAFRWKKEKVFVEFFILNLNFQLIYAFNYCFFKIEFFIIMINEKLSFQWKY